jgi:hypothetical protein
MTLSEMESVEEKLAVLGMDAHKRKEKRWVL